MSTAAPPPQTRLVLHLKSNPKIAAPASAGARFRCRRAASLAVRCLRVPIGGVAAGGAAADRLRSLADEFAPLSEPIDRVKRLLRYAAHLPPMPEPDRVPANRVMGCTAQVWLSAAMDSLGRMHFTADSDSEITKGFCVCLVSVLDGALPEEVLQMRLDDFGDINLVGLPGRTSSRVNTWHNVLIAMQKRTKALVAQGEGRTPLEPFPSLVIGPDGIQAKGSYAEAQESDASSTLILLTFPSNSRWFKQREFAAEDIEKDATTDTLKVKAAKAVVEATEAAKAMETTEVAKAPLEATESAKAVETVKAAKIAMEALEATTIVETAKAAKAVVEAAVGKGNEDHEVVREGGKGCESCGGGRRGGNGRGDDKDVEGCDGGRKGNKGRGDDEGSKSHGGGRRCGKSREDNKGDEDREDGKGCERVRRGGGGREGNGHRRGRGDNGGDKGSGGHGDDR